MPQKRTFWIAVEKLGTTVHYLHSAFHWLPADWRWKTLNPVSQNLNSESAFVWDTLYMYKRDYGDDLQSIMYSLGAGQGVGGVHKQQEEGGPSLKTEGGQNF